MEDWKENEYIHVDTDYSVQHNNYFTLNATCFDRKWSSSGVLLQKLETKLKCLYLIDFTNIKTYMLQ